MLQIANLSKKYGKYLAADHISFSVPDADFGISNGGLYADCIRYL